MPRYATDGTSAEDQKSASEVTTLYKYVIIIIFLCPGTQLPRTYYYYYYF